MVNKNARIKAQVKRVMLAALLPALVGSMLMSILGVFVTGELTTFAKGMLMFPLFAYYAVGLQSIVYSVILEFIINPYIKNHLLAISASVLLGGLVGGMQLQFDFFSIVLGALTGAIVGAYIRQLYRQATQPTQ